MSSRWVINDFPKLVPPLVFSIFVFLSLLLMPPSIYSLKPGTYPIDSFTFITSFPIIDLVPSLGFGWLCFQNLFYLPIIISLLWLGLSFYLASIATIPPCCFQPIYPVRNFSLKCKFGHFILFFNFFSGSNCQNSALLRRLTGLLSTSSNPSVFLPANTFTPARTCSLNTYHSCFLLFSSSYAYSSS